MKFCRDLVNYSKVLHLPKTIDLVGDTVGDNIYPKQKSSQQNAESLDILIGVPKGRTPVAGVKARF